MMTIYNYFNVLLNTSKCLPLYIFCFCFIQVIKAESDGYEVSYVKTTHTPGLFKWPDKPDIGWVTTDDIIKKLKPPKTENARMGYITFEEV